MSVQTEINRIKDAVTAIVNAIKGKGVTVPSGTKIDGLSQYVSAITTPNLQSKTVSPLTSSQTVKPDSSYNGLSQVTVNAMPTAERAETTITAYLSDENDIEIRASNNQKTGYVIGEDETARVYVNLDVNGKTAKASVGNVEITKDVQTASRASTSITTTADDTNDKLTLTASNNQGTGYVTGSNQTASKVITLTVSGATVTATDNSTTPVKISKSVSTASRASTSITTTADDTNDVLTLTASNNQSTGYVTGSNETATKKVTLTVSGATVTATDNSSTPVKISKSVATATRASTTLSSAKSNNTLVFTAGNNQGTGYVTGSNSTATKTVSLSTSGATVTASDGTNSISSTIGSGSATTPATTITKTPTISVDSSGKITASVSGTQSVTPTVSAGYVSSGTAGTITVSGSATQQLSTQAAKWITPSTSNQTAVTSGKYTTGAVTVYGDTNLKAEYIKKGISIFGVSGSYEGSGGSSNPSTVPATCTLQFYMDNFSPVAVACTQMTSSGVVSAFYQKLSKNTTVTVSNVVCGSTLLIEDTGGDGLWFSGSGEQCVQIGSLPNGKGVIYRTPATSGTYYFSFDRS